MVKHTHAWYLQLQKAAELSPNHLQVHMLKSLSIMPQNGTGSEDRVAKEVIRLNKVFQVVPYPI